MSSNSIKINGRNELEWYVNDAQMEQLISTLNTLGFKTQDGSVSKDYGKALAEAAVIEEEIFTRKELQKIQHKAEDMAGVRGMNPSWVEAYAKIADACDKLDSMMVEEVEKEAD